MQICDIISATCPRPAFVQTKETVVPKIENITSDDVNVIRNLLEQMIYLLVEEQSTGTSRPNFNLVCEPNVTCITVLVQMIMQILINTFEPVYEYFF